MPEPQTRAERRSMLAGIEMSGQPLIVIPRPKVFRQAFVAECMRQPLVAAVLLPRRQYGHQGLLRFIE
jgi:hypothetical protein